MKLLKQYRYGISLFSFTAFAMVALILAHPGDHGADAAVPGMEIPEKATLREVPSRHFGRPVVPAVRNFVDYMDRELDSTQTVGAAYTVVYQGRTLYTQTYGERRKGTGEPVDEHTLFRLASVSKGFTGALACMLEQEGVLSLDDRVVDHYPGFRLKDSISTNMLTLRHLLSHTTGLVPFAYDNLVEAGKELSQIVDQLDEVNLSGPPGKFYGYQNVTFSMWDPIARRATGTPYPVLLEEMIFKPLGMKDAVAGEVSRDPGMNMAFPHVRGSGGYFAMDPHQGYYNVLPAAGINASISDMEQWLLALLGHKPGDFPDTVRSLLEEPVIYTPLRYQYTRYWKPFRERYYSLGWRIYFYGGRKIMYHGGYIRGYRAEIAYCPEEDVGIAFLQNSPNSLASQVVPHFFDLWFATPE